VTPLPSSKPFTTFSDGTCSPTSNNCYFHSTLKREINGREDHIDQRQTQISESKEKAVKSQAAKDARATKLNAIKLPDINTGEITLEDLLTSGEPKIVKEINKLWSINPDSGAMKVNFKGVIVNKLAREHKAKTIQKALKGFQTE
jgi:hypothetical protein